MNLFENMLALLVLACLLLQVSRRLALPYPAMLALAGACVGALPWAPQVNIDPQLALALFIAPALLDSAFDTAPRELKRNWIPLVSLVVVAVLLTTAAVAWAGVALAGLPVAAAITLGAIVAPPDAVAAAAVLQRFKLPRRTVAILSGESLLNDAIALLVFGAAANAAMSTGATSGGTLATLLVAVPGGALFGYLAARLYVYIPPLVAGTLSSTIVEFVATFAVWVIAERLHISPILAVVAYGMTIASILPARSSPRDRVHSYSVWNATVFVLNVLAFLLMGLQARAILAGLEDGALWHALRFAGIVLAIVIGVRIAWVMTYGAILRAVVHRLERTRGQHIKAPSPAIGLIVSWSGMRGLVTLATAFALPSGFPARDVIVLCAFAVVLGTLIVQGLTISPLIKLLKIEPDDSLERQISETRTALMDAAIAALDKERGEAADATRNEYRAARELALDEGHPQEKTEHDRLRTIAIHAQREVLNGLRDSGKIEDDTYHRLEEELDWAELSALPTDHLRMQSV